MAAAPRARNEIWDTLTDLFGDPTTRTAQRLRGKMVASLRGAGATPDEILRRARRWPRIFPNAALTETALEKHWPLLEPRKRPPPSVQPEPQAERKTTPEEREANVKAAREGLRQLRGTL